MRLAAIQPRAQNIETGRTVGVNAVQAFVERAAEAELVAACVGRQTRERLGRHVGRRAQDGSRSGQAGIGVPVRRRRLRMSAGTTLSATPVWRARPKSITRVRPSLPMTTLPGLKSRWTRPAPCAAARPAAGVQEHRTQLPPASWLAGQPLLERDPVHQLHGDEDPVLPGAGIVDGHDVGMGQARQGLRLAQQSHAARRRLVRIRRVAAQQLQRDTAVQLGIEGGIHHAHPAAAQRLEHDVAADARAAPQRRGCPGHCGRIGHLGPGRVFGLVRHGCL